MDEGGAASGLALTSLPLGGRTLAVAERLLLATPFFRLIRFARAGARGLPPVLVVAPLSGMRPLLLYDMVRGLLPGHDVQVLVWPDAAEVPAAAGPFGLDDNIEAVAAALRHLGGGVHAVGLCQSALPLLAATALLAAEGGPAPATLTLIGGKLDTRIAPTRLDRLARLWPPAWFQRMLIADVPPGRPGHGRRVYPAGFEWLLLSSYMLRHFMSGGEIGRKMLDDDGADPAGHPFAHLFLAPFSLDETFFLDTIGRVLRRPELAEGALFCRGRRVAPEAITATALLTIEGGRDDIAAAGQTRIAHDLCPGLPAARRGHLLCPESGHFGLFHGALWRTQVLPRVAEFIAAAAGAGAGAGAGRPAGNAPSQAQGVVIGGGPRLDRNQGRPTSEALE